MSTSAILQNPFQEFAAAANAPAVAPPQPPDRWARRPARAFNMDSVLAAIAAELEAHVARDPYRRGATG